MRRMASHRILLLALLALSCRSAAARIDASNPCSVTGLPRPPANSPVSITAQTTGGIITGSSVEVDVGTVVQLTRDLTIVAKEDIYIAGRIRLPQNHAATIIIVSVEGSVNVMAGGSVGDGQAARGPSGGNGSNGEHAGRIIISAPAGSILIDGHVGAADGGEGGDGAIWGAGNAGNRGGDGGNGGDVLLCALEAINVGATGSVIGGEGGLGGEAYVKQIGGSGTAKGGTGGNGGSVKFFSPQLAFVNILGFVGGRDGGDGGMAVAKVESTRQPAVGGAGAGGRGGTVVFTNVVVTAAAASVEAGRGGEGGEGYAVGRKGRDGVPPTDGCNAEAKGGDGGARGTTPSWVNPQNVTISGTAGRTGWGWTAYAWAGPGGKSLNAAMPGGSSGRAVATGGRNGDGVPVAAPPDVKGPNAPIGVVGGLAATAQQFGQR